MPTWTAPGDGLWTDSANWSGGVPNAIGAIATFNQTSNTAGATFVNFLETAQMRVGVLNVTISGARDLIFAGSLGDTGSGAGRLVFENFGALGPAEVTINTAVGGGEFEISGFGGLQVELRARTDFNVVTAGTTARINAALLGDGVLVKEGAGTLLLSGNNSGFTGGFSISAGTLNLLNSNAFGGNSVQIDNDGTLLASGSINSGISMFGTNGRLQVSSGQTLTLNDYLGHRSTGQFTLGNATDNGTIVMNLTSSEHNPGCDWRLAGGTVRLENFYSAHNLFTSISAGLVEIATGATLDTRGFATRISNLDLDGGTVRTSTGSLDLLVFDEVVSPSSQTGTIEGTAGVDSLEVQITNSFSFAGTTFANWTSGTDSIRLVGSANANAITGSGNRDVITGGEGNDTLTGAGGNDSISGDGGDDLIILSSTNTNSEVSGGTGVDTLQISGGTVALIHMSGFEALQLNSGALLDISGAQFNSGLTSNAVLGGTGTIRVSMGLTTSFFATGMTVNPGSNISFNITGSLTEINVIKCSLNAINVIQGGGQTDQLRGGNFADTINGGGGADKIMGLGGADLLTGGSGNDQFRYLFTTDSGTGANADQILDWASGFDKLDFRTMDANAGLAGRQALTYVGTGAFSATGAAEVRWADLGADLRVYVDLDGNGTSDMEMLLVGAGNQTLSATDFMF